MNRSRFSRRAFMQSSAIAGAAIGFPTIIPASVLGGPGQTSPNSRVNVGMISCGDRSGYAINYKNYDKSQVVAVCDPIEWRRLARKREFDNCADYADFRDLLARPDIDAVQIATGDHWHVPIALMAAAAGKDMYVEKPLGVSIEEDLKSREIVERHGRIFQYGAQQRSMAPVRMGIELALNGHIGEIREALVWSFEGASGGKCEEIPVPDGFDYDMWLGPAPTAPFSHDRCIVQGGRAGVYHIYDYTLGFLTVWGAHPMDMLQWWIDNADVPKMPISCEATGSIPESGLFDTLTRWDAQFEYADGFKMRFMDNVTAASERPHPAAVGGHGTLLIGSEGWIRVSRDGWAFSDDNIRLKANDPGPIRLPVSTNQAHNFIDSVISRQQPVDDLESAIRSDIKCHLVDISARLGRKIEWDNEAETIVGDGEAIAMMKRAMRKPWSL